MKRKEEEKIDNRQSNIIFLRAWSYHSVEVFLGLARVRLKKTLPK